MAIDKAFCHPIYGSPRRGIMDRDEYVSEYMSASVCMYSEVE